ncbi:hypothetical protein TorRG33x02_208590 [Trema orientale]|uniref:Uncharacterized protein n=1 Tax=Trema orientale TaxID=63057 RepID=A0A2P5ECL9_TREOI|nr:hypothetical protein TorRG33x02_208590 [Trema orientale]
MAHSLSPAQATATTPTPFSTTLKKNTHYPCVKILRVRACHQVLNAAPHGKIVNRRTLSLGLAGALLGLNGSEWSARAAARRPPPPPPEEKKDPNVSGVQAKVLASKRRKEAMKDEIAKLREKGKAVKASSSSTEAPSTQVEAPSTQVEAPSE